LLDWDDSEDSPVLVRCPLITRGSVLPPRAHS
jgi:hypothetical protein